MHWMSQRHLRLVAAASLLTAACAGSTTPTSTYDPADVDRGALLYEALCASCHGPEATGTSEGPPLVDDIYRPTHHPDGAFLVAVRRGVPQHHWDFGPMLPLEGVTDEEVLRIAAYVRMLQADAGID